MVHFGGAESLLGNRTDRTDPHQRAGMVLRTFRRIYFYLVHVFLLYYYSFTIVIITQPVADINGERHRIDFSSLFCFNPLMLQGRSSFIRGFISANFFAKGAENVET